ncbi:protein YebE [Agaricicola taiwanensis]|uniref:Protein YebE n=1 Tax=Agaricicola taiwanensis TaxID=591372 RepID=A0A8J2YMY3_9RHOB|nr:DUF533 domain-containing protein [Agaricicola taiwanensis]GGE53501.1 protein YebE [Agaricicola taiwanensis]
MFDAAKLLDQLLSGKQGMANTSRGPASSGSLDISRRVQDLAKGQYGKSGGGLGNLANMGGMGSGALVGGLAAVLLGSKSGRKIGTTALKYGGLAVLGGLAYKAYSDWQANRPAAPSNAPAPQDVLPPPSSTTFGVLADPSHAQRTSEILVRSMIAAARSDGRIDAQETSHIREALSRSGMSDDNDAFLFEILGQPDDLDRLVAEVDSPELAAEAWLAARLTVDLDTDIEKAYMERLGQRFGLAPELVAHLEATAAGALAEQREAS